MECRNCKKKLKYCFIDLGSSPPSNSYLIKSQLNSVEKYYPLQVYICDKCWLAQVIDYAGRDIFFKSRSFVYKFFPKFLDFSSYLSLKAISILFKAVAASSPNPE